MQNQQQRFSFTGTGSEYFRIWIVNLLLTIVTLGIYSAWAKVKRNQYFYRNTWLNGSSFDYHGSPQAILKGRIIAVVLFGVYNVSIKALPPLGLAMLGVITIATPWLMYMSFRFRLANTSYRGLRFSFTGSLRSAYNAFLKWPLLAGLSLYTLAPVAHQRIKAYQHGNSRFGHTPFSFDASVGSFYKIYLKLFLVTVLVIGITAYLFTSQMHAHPAMFANKQAEIGLVVVMVYVAIVALSLLAGPYFVSRLQNLIWNHTRLGPHGLQYSMTARKLLWITVSNVAIVLLSFGLLKPFSDIRYVRYQVECMALLPEGDLEALVAGEQQQVSAVGTEVAGLFDFDIGF